MNISLLLSLLFLSSCGKYAADAGLGGVKSINPVTVEGEDLSRIKAVCSALAKKNAPSLVNSVAVFDYSKRNCNENQLGQPSSVTTTIANSFDSYKFVQSSGSSPYFSDIETVNKGLMASICSALNSDGELKSPLKENGSYLFFSAVNINSNDCSNVSGQVCVLLERGSEKTSGQASVHTKDWVRFNLVETQGRVGFFTMRKQITSGPCPQGQTQENLAVLK